MTRSRVISTVLHSKSHKPLSMSSRCLVVLLFGRRLRQTAARQAQKGAPAAASPVAGGAH